MCRVYKNETDFDAGKSELYMQVAGDDGRWYLPPQQPDEIINQILPSSLHQYFFFDGERIEQIVRSDKKAEIAEATKMLLGVEVLNRSIRHLGEAKKNLENELKAIGDSETKQLLKKQEKINQGSERILNCQAEINQEVEYQQTLKKETSNRLRELSAAKVLQERGQELEKLKKSNQDNLKQSKEALKRAISARGYTVFLSETTTQFRSIVNDLRQRGELTAGISREFVNELLIQQCCICGAELHEGSSTCESVRSWLDRAGSSAVEETAIRMSAQVDEIDKQAVAFWEEIDREQARITQLRQVINQIETDEPELVAEFGNIRRAFQVVLQVTDEAEWDAIAYRRSLDILVYLALIQFSQRPTTSQLAPDIRHDIKAFFGTYQEACEVADKMLFSLGKPGVIAKSCQQSKIGKRLPTALYVHVSALEALDPLLRIYEGCASRTIGRLEGATLVKFYTSEPKISYLFYPDFDTDPHPALHTSMQIDLRNLKVSYRNYDTAANPPILHRKETFVTSNYPLYEKFANLTRQEEKWGLLDKTSDIGTRTGWQRCLAEHGAQLRGHRLIRRKENESLSNG